MNIQICTITSKIVLANNSVNDTKGQYKHLMTSLKQSNFLQRYDLFIHWQNALY